MRQSPPACGNTAAMRRLNLSSESTVAALLLLVALAARCVDFGNPVIHVDEQYYLLVGDRLLHGALTYVDIWDRKPIGLFAIFAEIRLLPGRPRDPDQFLPGERWGVLRPRASLVSAPRRGHMARGGRRGAAVGRPGCRPDRAGRRDLPGARAGRLPRLLDRQFRIDLPARALRPPARPARAAAARHQRAAAGADGVRRAGLAGARRGAAAGVRLARRRDRRVPRARHLLRPLCPAAGRAADVARRADLL